MSKTPNGVAAPTNGATAKPVELPKNEVKTTVPVLALPAKKAVDTDNLPPLDDRILKIQMLGDLVAKREKLQESLKKITSLKFSSDGRADKLTIEDDENEWTTSNSYLLKEVVATIKATIQKKIAEVDLQLTF